MWVLIDNYDSFTWMLHDYLLQAGAVCAVYRNDELTLQQLIEISPARIIISPGPETPQHAGITMQVIAHFHDKVPILGVCLGHQALGIFYGARLCQLAYPMHGKTSIVTHSGHALFKHIPTSFDAMRYHSLIVDDFIHPLSAIAHADDGTVMALAHSMFPSIGVQFHPESIGTPVGLQIIKNWAALEFDPEATNTGSV